MSAQAISMLTTKLILRIAEAGGAATTKAVGSLDSVAVNKAPDWTNLVTFNAGGWNGNGTAPFDDDTANSDYGTHPFKQWLCNIRSIFFYWRTCHPGHCRAN